MFWRAWPGCRGGENNRRNQEPGVEGHGGRRSCDQGGALRNVGLQRPNSQRRNDGQNESGSASRAQSRTRSPNGASLGAGCPPIAQARGRLTNDRTATPSILQTPFTATGGQLLVGRTITVCFLLVGDQPRPPGGSSATDGHWRRHHRVESASQGELQQPIKVVHWC